MIDRLTAPDFHRCVAFIAMGKCLPNELVDMIQHLIGSEDPVVAVWDDRTGPMATAHALKKRMEGKATVPDMEAEMARLYEVAKLADMEEIVAHFEDLGRRHRIAGVVVPKYSG